MSSESCGFLSMGAKYIRDVYPGEIVEFTKEGFHTVSIMGRPHDRPQAFCIFEYVYFARPDSIYEGNNKMCAHLIRNFNYIFFKNIKDKWYIQYD